MGIHWQELSIILLIALVLFGPKRLPEIGSSLGRGIRGFRSSLEGKDEGQVRRTVEANADAAAGEPVAVPVPVEVVGAPQADKP